MDRYPLTHFGRGLTTKVGRSVGRSGSSSSAQLFVFSDGVRDILLPKRSKCCFCILYTIIFARKVQKHVGNIEDNGTLAVDVFTIVDYRHFFVYIGIYSGTVPNMRYMRWNTVKCLKNDLKRKSFKKVNFVFMAARSNKVKIFNLQIFTIFFVW